MPADTDESRSNAGSVGADPRAFVTATGFVFQIIGLIMSGGGCLLWSLSDWLQEAPEAPVAGVEDLLRADVRAAAIGMAAITGSFIAGLALVATGVGLQGERPTAGRWALVAASALALLWWGCVAALWLDSAPIWQLGTAALVALLCTALFLLAGNCARILKLHPPPRDQNAVNDAFLREYSSRRHE